MRTFVLVLAMFLAVPASAGAASPWQPFRSAPFDLPAGSRCPFELTGAIVRDKERIRTLSTYADGSPAQQEVTGLLVVRYTNVATGESIDRNLTGDALIDLRPDGTIARFTLVEGHLAVGLGAGDAGGPAFLVLSGSGFAVDFAPDGSRTVTTGTGTAENVCQTLG
jgi:hypothetical protein